MTGQNTPNPFISYAREDLFTAKQLQTDLRRLGANPWLDIEALVGGADWEREIRHAVQTSSHVVVLMSKHSVNKRGYVQKEVRLALDIYDEYPPGEIYLVPVRLDDTQPRHEGLNRLHWIDLFPDYQTGLSKLAASLGLSRELVRYHSDNTYYDLVDSFGSKALVRSVEVVEAISGNINTLYTRALTGSGKIENVASNLGKVEIVNEGGVISVNVHLASSLPIGEKVEHVLTYEGVNCFTESRETVTQNVTRILSSTGVHVTVPTNRPLRHVEGTVALEGQPEKGGQLEVHKDTLGASFSVNNPVVGTRLILTWDW